MQSPREASPVEEFGPYAVFERLGLGGMATVHRAKKRGIEGFERVVALKRLLPHLAEDADFVKSFVREAKLASLLMHANIVQIYELGRVGGVYFISMEHVDGWDVRKILRQARRIGSPPPANVVLTIMTELCEALDYAHTFSDESGQSLGIVHRDVSPSNLIVSRSGHLKVIDFGIAKATSQQLRTQTGRVKGKLGYMSPEAALGRPLDARSDIFSAGVILHELLTARPLFASKTDFETLDKIQKGIVPAASQINQAVPPELDAVIAKSLARDADDRYHTAGELRRALDEVVDRIGARFSNRDVVEWGTWAFSQEVPVGDFGGRSMSSASWQRVSASPINTGDHSGPVRNPFAGGSNPGAQLGSRRPSTHVSTIRTPLPLPPPLAEEPEPPLAEMVWNVEGEGQPVVLDDVPDLALEAGTPSTVTGRGTGPGRGGTGQFGRGGSGVGLPAGMRAAQAQTMIDPAQTASAPVDVGGGAQFGASLVERRSGGGLWLKIGAAIAGVAVIGVVAFVLTRGDGGKSQEKAKPTAATPASINFVIQPADATIEIGGELASKQSPFEANLEAGLYTVKIARDGYKTWVTDLSVRDGERQTIRVALEKGGSNTARIMIKSDPLGLEILVDGQPIADKKTPAELDVTPGFHKIVVKDASGQEWVQELTAEADTQYAFHAVTGKRELQEREEQRKLTRAREESGRSAIVSRDTSSTGGTPTTVSRIDTGLGGTAIESAPVAPPPPPIAPSPSPAEVEPSPSPAASPVASPVATATATATPPQPAVTQPAPSPKPSPVQPPPPAPPPPKAKAAPVIVPPTAVTKVSGKLPKLEAKNRGGALNQDIIAKMCIDESGRVTTADVMRSPPDIKDDVARALKGWRYRPYMKDGAAVPACFGLTMRIKIEED